MIESINEWLKCYSYLINGILTFATIIYVIITGWILLTQKQLNAQNILPHLVLTSNVKVDKIAFEEMMDYYRIEIKNIGRGPALNLKVNNFPKQLSFEISSNYVIVSEVISVNFTIPSYNPKFENFYKEGKIDITKINFDITYEDMNKKEYFATFLGRSIDR